MTRRCSKREREERRRREEGRCKISVVVDVSACTLEELCSRRIRCTARGLALLMGGKRTVRWGNFHPGDKLRAAETLTFQLVGWTYGTSYPVTSYACFDFFTCLAYDN